MAARMPNDPIVISDSEDDDVMIGPADFDEASPSDATPGPIEVDGEDDKDDDDEDNDEGLEIVTGHDWQELQKHKATAHGLLGVLPGQEVVKFVDVVGNRLKPGISVPLVGGDFFRVKYLTRDKQTHEVAIHGWLLKRATSMSNQLMKVTGDLALAIVVDENDRRPDLERGLEERSLNDIDFCAKKFSRDIIFTNCKSPSYRDDPRNFNDKEDHWARGRLVCRVKNIKFWSADTDTKGGVKITQEGWVWLTEDEADKGCGVPDISHTIKWRQDRDKPNTKRGRESVSSESVVSDRQTKRTRRRKEGELVEIEMSEHHELRVKRKTTTYSTERPVTLKVADLCCGAGGVAAGMEEGGFQVAVGVDSWKPAAETFALNWPAARTYEQDVRDFVINGKARKCTYCHVVHFSLPCQRFSPMNTNIENNERDEENLATHLVVEEALKSLRPLYATFENTSGLKEISKHRDYYNTLIKNLTDLGWNAVLKVEKLSKYGNPQKRRRLIVIASCPGMKLIDFPLPTHGEQQGLLPLRTVGEVIRDVNPKDPLHNRREQRRRQKQLPSRTLVPADLNAPLRHLITTAGPNALHPNGKRRFTFREGMRLMRFRDEHRLAAKSATDKWKLIGNAVPRDIIKLIYTDIHKVLSKWFEEFHAPIDLEPEHETIVSASSSTTPGSPTPTRRVKAKAKPSARRLTDALEPFDREDEDLRQAMRASLSLNQPAPKAEETVNNDDITLRPKKKAKPTQTAVKEEAKPFEVVDLMDSD